jgi:hypothetical protein
MRVGDLVELELKLAIRDKRKDSLQLAMIVPRSLKALDRVNLTLQPKRHKLNHRFRFQVVAPTAGARMTVVTTRGLLQEIHHCDYAVNERELTLTIGSTGIGDGVQSAEIKVPKNAIKGSVKAHTRVVPAVKKVKPIIVRSVESVERALSQPSGCFEQTSSSNYPNLEILSKLKAAGKDGETLELAYKYAHSGFKKIKSFQGADGGFSLWANNKKHPKAHYTAMGLMQMALYARLFDGRGSYQMQKALSFLAKKKLDPIYKLYALYAISEYAAYSEEAQGQIFMDKLLEERVVPDNNYQRALLANALMLRTDDSSKAQFHGLIKQLKKAQRADGSISSKGHGVMGSAGQTLTVETTALATVAFKNAGDIQSASACAQYVVTCQVSSGGWWGTQGTALSIRALTQVPATPVITGMKNERINPIKVSAAGFRKTWAPDAEKQGPHRFSVPLRENRKKVQFSMAIPKGHPMEYGFSISYRIAMPQDSRSAPFKITTSMASRLTVDETTPLTVTMPRVIFKERARASASGFAVRKKVSQRKAMPKGQFVASIGIPGGCVVEDFELVKAETRCDFVEFKNGALNLYWEELPALRCFTFPVKAVIAGNYVGAPTVFYPYYESGRECYAAGVGVKVLGRRYQVSDDEAKAAKGLGK